MNSNLAWIYMVDFLSGSPMNGEILAGVIADSVGNIVNYRVVGKK
jgi:hypothetical protein